jgi:mono/diheme cytochrome c family protein
VLARTQSVATNSAPAGNARFFAWLLNDRQAAAVLTYIRNTWGNAAPEVTADDVAKRRAALAKAQ